jgi:type VI secretion system secreted protein Hcp
MSDSKRSGRLGIVGRPLLAGAIAAAGAGAALPAAADTFMLLDGVQGESNDSKHKDWIDILSYTQTYRNTAPAVGGGGAGAAKVTCGDVTVLKSIDKSSPRLIEGVVSGANFKSAKIDFVIASAQTQTAYYNVAITDVQIVAVEQTDQPDDARIVERVTLRGGRFEYTYREQDAKGQLGPDIKFTYDCRNFKF